MILTICFHPNHFVSIIIGLLRSQVIFFDKFFFYFILGVFRIVVVTAVQNAFQVEMY
jgi:hypothetical protein